MLTRKTEQKLVVRAFMRGGDDSVSIRSLSNEMPEKMRMFSTLLLNPNASIGMHSHGDHELMYVLRGGGQAHEGDRIYEIREGDCLSFLPNVPHNVVNSGKSELKLLICIVKP